MKTGRQQASLTYRRPCWINAYGYMYDWLRATEKKYGKHSARYKAENLAMAGIKLNAIANGYSRRELDIVRLCSRRK